MTTDWHFPSRLPFAMRVFKALSKERWPLLLTLTLSLGLATVIIRRIPAIYSSSSKVLIEYPRSTEQLTGLDTQVELGRLDTVGERVNPINNQVALVKSYPVFKKALAQLNLSEKQVPYKELSVKAVEGTDLLEITYKSKSASLAAKVVQTVVDIYIKENLLNNREKGASARKFLEQRLPELANQLKKAQNQLEQFQSQNRFLGTTVETDALTNALNNLETQVNTARTELAFTEQKIARLQTQLPSDLTAAVNVAGLSQEAGYQQLQTQLVLAETDLAQLQIRLTDQNPQVVAAKQKRNQLKVLLQERSLRLVGNQANALSPTDPLHQRLVEKWVELETERFAQVTRLGKLSQQLQQLQERSKKLPQLIKQQTQLQQSAEAAQKEYLTFKEKYTASQIAEEQNISNVRVVEPAEVNLTPAAPNRKLLFTLAAVISTGISLGVVWLCRCRNNDLDGIVELRDILPLSIIATVPWYGNGLLSPEENENLDKSPLASSYQLLQANIRMLPRNVQIVAVCSWAPAEGCSSVAKNLALLEARSGHRVLFIDADKRSAAQPEFWQTDQSQPSVEHSLNGKILGHTIQHKVLSNLDILSSDDTPSVVMYKEWLALLEQKRKQYDLIVIDCAPVSHSTDATVLASMSDGVVWVVCPKRLGRRRTEASAENLQTWSTRLLGQVIIGVESNQLPVQTPNDRLKLPKLTHRQFASLQGVKNQL